MRPADSGSGGQAPWARRDILLVAVNARYSHCSHAARSLLANLGDLAASADFLETDLTITPYQLAAQLAARRPRIVGFSLYLWNVRIVEAAARILRLAAPRIRLVAGGPETTRDYPNAALFDAVIVGEGERAFRDCCEAWLAGPEEDDSPRETRSPRLIETQPEPLDALSLPYRFYSDTDLAQRTVYVEASRGCAHACAFCASAGTRPRLMPLERLLPELDRLWQRGLRRFKFLDRNFNAAVAQAIAILDFFLKRATPDTRLHLEINPDYMERGLLGRLAAFPPESLHLEVGLQTLNPAVAVAIGRPADRERSLAHLRQLTRETSAQVHADLIFGLPGEDEASFSSGFNRLVATCSPPELQVNLLKGLPGTRIVAEAARFGLAFNPEPPYELVRSDRMDFETLLRLQRFAHVWDRLHNRGRFPRAVNALRAARTPDIFQTYDAIARRLHDQEGRVFAIALPCLASHLRDALTADGGLPDAEADALIAADLNARPRS